MDATIDPVCLSHQLYEHDLQNALTDGPTGDAIRHCKSVCH